MGLCLLLKTIPQISDDLLKAPELRNREGKIHQPNWLPQYMFPYTFKRKL